MKFLLAALCMTAAFSATTSSTNVCKDNNNKIVGTKNRIPVKDNSLHHDDHRTPDHTLDHSSTTVKAAPVKAAPVKAATKDTHAIVDPFPVPVVIRSALDNNRVLTLDSKDRLIIGDYTPSSNAQKWRIGQKGNHYFVCSLKDGTCLEDVTKEVDQVVSATPNQNVSGMWWTPVKLADGFYGIFNQNGLALDIAGSNTQAGTQVITYPFRAGHNQEWKIETA